MAVLSFFHHTINEIRYDIHPLGKSRVIHAHLARIHIQILTTLCHAYSCPHNRPFLLPLKPFLPSSLPLFSDVSTFFQTASLLEFPPKSRSLSRYSYDVGPPVTFHFALTSVFCLSFNFPCLCRLSLAHSSRICNDELPVAFDCCDHHHLFYFYREGRRGQTFSQIYISHTRSFPIVKGCSTTSEVI